MRKQLGFSTSLVLLLATAALWVGCSHQNQDDSRLETQTISSDSRLKVHEEQPAFASFEDSYQPSYSPNHHGVD